MDIRQRGGSVYRPSTSEMLTTADGRSVPRGAGTLGAAGARDASSVTPPSGNAFSVTPT